MLHSVAVSHGTADAAMLHRLPHEHGKQHEQEKTGAHESHHYPYRITTGKS